MWVGCVCSISVLETQLLHEGGLWKGIRRGGVKEVGAGRRVKFREHVWCVDVTL